MLKDMVDKVVKTGANVLICQKGIDDIAQHYLAKNSVLAVRRVKESDMTMLAKATGGRVVTNLEDFQRKILAKRRLSRKERSRRTSGSSSKAARTRRLRRFSSGVRLRESPMKLKEVCTTL